MLDLRRLRLLRELHERETIAAVADALRFTPSAVSQQLAVLEREAGVTLLERAGRGVRLTDAALVLVGHAEALLDRAALAEAELAAAAGSVAGRGRIAAFQSVALRVAVPAMHALAQEAPGLRCELVEAEPETSLPALALGDIDLVLADEWQHQPLSRPPGVDRHDLHRDPVRVVLPEAHPVALRQPVSVPLRELAGEAWTTGHRGTAWEEMTERTCRRLGGFDPNIRHRTNDSVVSLALVAEGLAITMLPDLVAPGAHRGVAVRTISEGSVQRTIFAATRTADATRPSVRALLAAVRVAAKDVGW
jgi:DNA-binding transcriptional LysR family regulator